MKQQGAWRGHEQGHGRKEKNGTLTLYDGPLGLGLRHDGLRYSYFRRKRKKSRSRLMNWGGGRDVELLLFRRFFRT